MKKLTSAPGGGASDEAVSAAAPEAPAAPVAASGTPSMPPPAAAFDAAHPHEGGSYIRQPDGSLTRASDEEEPA